MVGFIFFSLSLRQPSLGQDGFINSVVLNISVAETSMRHTNVRQTMEPFQVASVVAVLFATLDFTIQSSRPRL